MIQFLTPAGHTVYINPLRVTSVSTFKRNALTITVISFGGDDHVETLFPVHEVAEKIGNYLAWLHKPEFAPQRE